MFRHTKQTLFQPNISSYQPRILQHHSSLITEINKLANILQHPDSLYIDELEKTGIIAINKDTHTIVYQDRKFFNDGVISSEYITFGVSNLNQLQDEINNSDHLLDNEKREYERVNTQLQEKRHDLSSIRFQNSIEIQTTCRKLTEDISNLELQNMKLLCDIYKKQLRLRELCFIRNELLTFDFELRMEL